MLGAVIVAAGSSRRMGFDKLAALIQDIPVLARTLLAFEKTDCVQALTVVTRQDQISWVQSLGTTYGISKLRAIVAGGKERQDSVLAGLRSFDGSTEWAAVHDGARPLIAPAQMERCFIEAQTYGSACLAAPVTDTIKRADANRTVLETVDRSALWSMQTPQIFRRQPLIQAYETIIQQGQIVTDESAAMESAGHQVHLVASESVNFKITFPQDLKLAEIWLQNESLL